MKLQETSAEKYKEEPIVDSEIKETQPVEESSVLQSELQASAEEVCYKFVLNSFVLRYV